MFYIWSDSPTQHPAQSLARILARLSSRLLKYCPHTFPSHNWPLNPAKHLLFCPSCDHLSSSHHHFSWGLQRPPLQASYLDSFYSNAWLVLPWTIWFFCFKTFHGLQTSFIGQKAFKMWTRLSSQVSPFFILPFCTPFPQTQMYLPCQALLPLQVTDLLPGTRCLPSSPLNYLLYFPILQDFSLPSGICLIPTGAGVLSGRKWAFIIPVTLPQGLAVRSMC